MIDGKTFRVVTREHYTIDLEFINRQVYFHTNVTKMSPAILKAYKKDLKIVEDMCFLAGSRAIFAVGSLEDTKLISFGKLLGFEVLDHKLELPDIDGIARKILTVPQEIIED